MFKLFICSFAWVSPKNNTTISGNGNYSLFAGCNFNFSYSVGMSFTSEHHFASHVVVNFENCVVSSYCKEFTVAINVETIDKFD